MPAPSSHEEWGCPEALLLDTEHSWAPPFSVWLGAEEGQAVEDTLDAQRCPTV